MILPPRQQKNKSFLIKDFPLTRSGNWRFLFSFYCFKLNFHRVKFPDQFNMEVCSMIIGLIKREINRYIIESKKTSEEE
jgi:hypothetical protein